MHDNHVIELQDLPAEQASLVCAFAEFLRVQSMGAAMPNIEWSEGSAASFANGMNPQEDAVYDNRQERY